MELTFFSVLLILFCVSSLLQVAFFFVLRWRKPLKADAFSALEVPVSVIICAKNEHDNLNRFLRSVLEQDYPGDLFEVIVVNDQSVDASSGLLDTLAAIYPHLRIVTIPQAEVKTLPGKKYALAQGIAEARHERILLTDADCVPASKQWLRRMALQPKAIVLGYGAYLRRRGGLNAFIRWETVHTAMQYMSYAYIGRPYMGVGRNLCYNKSLLQQLKEDQSFQEVYSRSPSGDDDLLISRIATATITGVCTDYEAQTLSLPQESWAAWWRQKQRHSSVGKYYAPRIKQGLGLYALSHHLYWFSAVVLLLFFIFSKQVVPATLLVFLVALFLVRLGLYWWNAGQWYRGLREKGLLLFFPLGDLGWAIYNVLLSPYIFLKNRQEWK